MRKLIIVLCLLFAVPAMALSRVSWLNFVAEVGEADCYEPGGNADGVGLVRECALEGVVYMELPVSTPQNYVATVYARKWLDAQTVSCRLETVSNAGLITTGPDVAITVKHTAFQAINLPSRSMYSNGILRVRCLVGEGAQLLMVEYQPG